MMASNLYRECTFAEKRRILSTYWSQSPADNSRLEMASRQYGAWASALGGAVWLELIFVTFVLIGRHSQWSDLTIAAASLWSVGLWYALRCQLVISRRSDLPAMGSATSEVLHEF